MCAVLNVLRLMPIADITKCRSPKNGKNWGFSPPDGDRINRSRRNLAGKRTPLVCYSTLHLALIGKRGTGAPKMSKFAQIFLPPQAETMYTFRSNFAGKCRPSVCYTTPNLALVGERGRYKNPQSFKICPKLWFLATGSRHNEHIQMKFGG